MRVEDAVRIRHMIGAAESALSFIKNRTRSDLGDDQMLQIALVRAVEVVGEAASKVSADGPSPSCALDRHQGNAQSAGSRLL